MVRYNEDEMIEGVKLIAYEGKTIREAANTVGVSKSALHKYMGAELLSIDIFLYEDAHDVLDKHRAERHMRGGLATKRMFAQKAALKAAQA